jgi:4-amino-4-deoxy-L-arabinose transferase-like glycosyltransferase
MGHWLAPSERRCLTAGDQLLLLAVALVVLLPGTFGVSLFDRDEGWYAQVSREMVQSGDWLIPHYLGEPWLGKPPLLYWCVAASWAVLGTHAWAARLVSVLALAGVVQLLSTLAAELFNRRAALIAGLSFLTAALPVFIGKLLLTDALLLWWCLAAIVCLWRISTQGATIGRAALFWMCLGLGILSKGPAILVFVGAFGLALPIQNPKSKIQNLPAFWLASPLCLLVAAPWYVYVAQHAGETFAQQFLWFEVTARVVGAPHGHAGPPGYYVAISLAGWLPWTALVPGAILEAWRSRKTDAKLCFLLLWLGLPWLLLELLPSKLPHYILPCYVPLAILLGRMWDVGLDRPVTRPQRVALGLWGGVMELVGMALIAAAIVWRAATWSLALGAAGAVLMIGFAFVWRSMRVHQLRGMWTRAAGTAVAFQVLVGAWLLPSLEPHRLSRQIAERASALGDPATEVLVCGYTEPSLFFYLTRTARVLSAADVAALPDDFAAPRVLIVSAGELQAAGLSGVVPGETAVRVDGFNYVKGRAESVWVLYQLGPSTRSNVNTTAPAKT